MTFNLLLEYLPYAIVTNFTPGPNNILALNSTRTYGFRKSSKVLLGICMGFTCIMIICGIVCIFLGNISDVYQKIMKYIGVIYICWLAWHIFNSRPVNSSENSSYELTFLHGFLAQFINIKVMLYGMVSLSTFVLPYNKSVSFLFLFILGMSTLGAFAALVWALAGSIFQKYLNKYYKFFNTVMSIILLKSAFSLLY
ncbi:LysE family transporter [Fusobacterium necrophorum]|uniref:LysE family transporter n=1 Tax=Fusobacterium necrophorum TaxID=859 RepID=UPI00055F79D4|nr:LysE family transporter [Fusobacterium necrophorum]